MATLWIREYQTMTRAADGSVPQIAPEPGVADQTVTFTTTTQSAAFNSSTRYIAITADAAFHYVVGSNPTATTSAMKIQADAPPFYIAVPSGGAKIAVVAA